MPWGSAKRTLTIENNNVKLPVAEQLVLVGDAGPETAGPPQGQSEQDLALLLVQRNGLTVVLFQTVVIHGAKLEEQTDKKYLNSSQLTFLGGSCSLRFGNRPRKTQAIGLFLFFSTINVHMAA